MQLFPVFAAPGRATPVVQFEHSPWQRHTAYPWGAGGWRWGSPLLEGWDENGSGEIFFPIWVLSAQRLELAVSSDRGATWRYVSLLGGGTFNPGDAPACAVQDSTGAVHLLCEQFNATWRYSRITLNRTSGQITSFSVAQAPFYIGDASPSQSGDARAQLRIVVDQAGTERVAWIAADQPFETSTTRVVAGVSTGLTPSSAASFVRFDGSAGFDTVWTDTINPHEFAPHLVQIPSTRAIYIVWSHIVAQGFNDNSTHAWRYRKLSTSGASTWSTGAWIVREASTHIHNVVATSDRIWLLRNENTSGLHIDTIDAADTLTPDVIPSPSAGRVTGTRQASLVVSPTGAYAFCAWQTWVGYATGVECVKAAYGGGAWTIYTDAEHDASGDAWGILSAGGNDGWADGAIFLKIGVDDVSRTPYTSTLRRVP